MILCRKRQIRSLPEYWMFRTGQNPTGGTLNVDRRREIYRLACKYDIVILEDGA